jgi:hypothetical protein
MPAIRAYLLAMPTLRPVARTSACGWWNQIVTLGLRRRMNRMATRVSISEPGAIPEV